MILRGGDNLPYITKNGSAFVFGKDTIGSNIDECLAWLNSNPDRKEYLLKMVKSSDVIGIDNLDEAMLTPEKEDVASDLADTETEEQIRNKAKELMVRHWHIPHKIGDVKLAIVEAEKIWKEVHNFKLQSKVDQMKKPNLEKIAELIKETKKQLMTAVV